MARQVNKLVVHCSDSPDTMDIGYVEIDRWHKERFSGVDIGGQRIYCGYHFIIRRDGTIEPGRPEAVPGAHVKGHNSRSIGICWVGRSQMSLQQADSLVGLLRVLLLRYGLGAQAVLGHYELDAGKTCPNIDMHQLRSELRKVIP